ncbi:hypothetical protein NP493_857g00034 [Ridgeia piscesae]|uniref:Uncharacterized protein n=1 Tax=Ridgeia piscesae TaxID=27915 RepID=A0AAD9KLA8_RIDPI|nr:hypothetical protein NP493_857g00034 [Ridgeia piscesae]
MYAVCRRESLYKTASPGSSRQSPAGYKQLAWPWLPHSGFLQQAVIEEFDTAMNVPKTSRRLIRPSSAAANLQTHRKYQTSLYDDIWTQQVYAKLGQRPKTQAGGSRLGDAAQTGAEEEETTTRADEARRLTVGEVDGLASKDGVNRILFSRATARSSLKEKVSHVSCPPSCFKHLAVCC